MHLRLAKGLTQAQLAELLNTKQESIARLESGSPLPSLSTVKRVAAAPVVALLLRSGICALPSCLYQDGGLSPTC